MAENTNDSQVVETEEELTNYTTETNAGAGTGTSAIEPGYGTGRRKEAVARVRLVPGDGKWTINGRTLEEYFPNKVHQQLIKAPLVLVDRLDTVDIFAHLDGGGPSGQAGRKAGVPGQEEERPPPAATARPCPDGRLRPGWPGRRRGRRQHRAHFPGTRGPCSPCRPGGPGHCPGGNRSSGPWLTYLFLS